MGCPNPSKMEQSWKCTFLKLFTHTNTKLASKTNSIIGLQQAGTANTAHQGCIGRAHLLVVLKSNDMGKEFQKSALSTLFYFVRVRAAFQLHVLDWQAKKKKIHLSF